MRVVRLALLVLVICGIAGMHSLGHGRHDAQATDSVAMPAEVMSMADDLSAHNAAVSVTAHLSDHPVLPGDATTVCLALLAAGFGLVLAARLWTRRTTVRRDPVGTSGSRRPSSRAPPAWRPFPLRLAAMTVLRI